MEKGKKGQLTLFVILGIVLVAGIVGYFLLRGGISSGIPKDLEPAYNAYLSCIQDSAERGVKILSQQGGYLYIDELDFDSGNAFMPFSSQLDFYGNPVPYWLYVSGNNLLKEQLPTKSSMEADLERYVQENINDCDFSSFNEQGIYADIYNGSVDIKINSGDIQIDVKNPVYLSFENESAYVREHSVKISSKLGEFYDNAFKLFNLEKSDSFLEAYALDVLRLNAPVTGVEITCSPKVFNEQNIKNDLATALENNFAYLKVKGDYYSLNDPKESYFVVDMGEKVNHDVNFIYSKNWPTRIEMYGDKIVQPVGT